NERGVTEVDVDISTPTSTPPVRYRSVVELVPRPQEPLAFEVPAWPLEPLAKTLEHAYRDWTFHGPLFQPVTAIAGVAADAIVGKVYAAAAIPALRAVSRPEWIIDPFVFDAALQLLLIWSRSQHDKTALPSRFQVFRRYRSLSDQPLTCYVSVE